jgi:hypothetical protein
MLTPFCAALAEILFNLMYVLEVILVTHKTWRLGLDYHMVCYISPHGYSIYSTPHSWQPPLSARVPLTDWVGGGFVSTKFTYT